MLARSGRLPTSGDWSYEVKWDGFRAIVSTESGLRVRSRRFISVSFRWAGRGDPRPVSVEMKPPDATGVATAERG
jgi:hypothetical protein